MTETGVRSYDKYRNSIKRIVAYFGVWPNYEGQKLAMGRFLTTQAVLCCVLLFSAVVFSCYLNSKNLGAFSTHVGGMVAYITVILRITSLGLNQKDMQWLNSEISARFDANLKVPENRQHLLAHFPTFSRFFYVYAYANAGNMVLLALTPLALMRRGIYVRLQPMVVPFSVKPGGLVHWMIYLFELLGVWNIWIVSTGTDNLFAMYCFQIGGELRLLSNRFRNLSSSDSYGKELEDCVQTHVDLREAFHKLQEMFGTLVLWFAISTAICLCCLIFQGLQMETLSALRVFYLLDHTFVKLMQVYLLTWSGHMVSLESEVCVAAAYEAQWSNSGDKRLMKDVLTVVTQRPMVFKAKKMLELRMELFMKIVNTSISYFFLLQTLDESA